MEASDGMITGSHKRNEIVLIHHDADISVTLSNCSLLNLLELSFYSFGSYIWA